LRPAAVFHRFGNITVLMKMYGKRPYEWGSDPDRQKANTKEEEKDLGLLNEGMRYRDLETGTFLTRDPLGYKDGPNVYCYVHCNPITHFDLLGLLDAVLYDKGDSGPRWGGKADNKVFASAANKMGEALGVFNLEQGVDAVSTLRQQGQVIDKAVIIDHGPEGGGFQDLGSSAINPYDKNNAELYNSLGRMVKDGGYIEHLGCQTGKDEKALQEYANVAGKTVVAYTENTEYKSDGKGGYEAKPSGVVYKTPQPLEKRQVEIPREGKSNMKPKTEWRLFRGDTDVTKYVLSKKADDKNYDKNLSRNVEKYEIPEEKHYVPDESKGKK